MQMTLTHPWRGHPKGTLITVTPGQRTMILALEKGIDYRAPAEKPEPAKPKKTK